jgi:hypothetical protein
MKKLESSFNLKSISNLWFWPIHFIIFVCSKDVDKGLNFLTVFLLPSDSGKGVPLWEREGQIRQHIYSNNLSDPLWETKHVCRNHCSVVGFFLNIYLGWSYECFPCSSWSNDVVFAGLICYKWSWKLCSCFLVIVSFAVWVVPYLFMQSSL